MSDSSTEDSTFTIEEFCRHEKLSRASFHKLCRRGLGPQVLRIPGTRIVRISAAARREWHAQMLKLSAEKAAALEQARRVELASRAGKAAVASGNHVQAGKSKRV